MAWSGSGHGGAAGNGTQSNGTHSWGGHAGGGGGGGGGWNSPARMAAMKARQAANEHHMMMLAASLCGLMAIFIILHWTRRLFGKASHTPCSTIPFLAPFAAISRTIRSLLIRKVPRFNSAGHALLVTAYVGINAAVCFTDLDFSNYSNFAARAGWMTASNLCFVVFLALKNTPLAFLTSYSYERLNCLHQVAGCTTFVFLVLHAVTYTVYFSKKHLLSILVKKEQIAAIIAGFAFLSLTLSAIVLRPIWYELFYVLHIAFFIVAIICSCFHQPEFGKKIIIILLLAAAMWFTDRLIRVSRALYYASNNKATVIPLPNGATKVVIKKVPTRSEPGKHFYVWIPAVRLFEMHPFTVVGTQPLEFIINSHNGFTRDLHRYAQAHPGAQLRASIDGPYGTFPDPMEYDKIVLIAGGSGASFTFGLAVNLLERMTETSNKSIVFIWTVRQHDNLAWFTRHLETLHSHPHSGKVNISLYVTRAPVSPEGRIQPDLESLDLPNDDRSHTMSSASSAAGSPTTSRQDMDKSLSRTRSDMTLPPIRHHRSTLSDEIEKEMMRETDVESKMMTIVTTSNHPGAVTAATTASNTPENRVTTTDEEKRGAVTPEPGTRRRRPRVTAGRPDAATLIRDAVQSTPASQRILVAACGPPGLMKTTRNVTAKAIKLRGPSVELHCEHFGW